ncbi:MAG: hypothetical protein ACTSUQ_03275 [Candidatus Freyarchaeota archaeon]
MGKNYPLEYLLGSDDLSPGGITLKESRVFAEELVNAGMTL